MQHVLDAVFVLASLAAACSDARTRRIPNALTLSLIAFGIAGHLTIGGWNAAAPALGLALGTIVVGSFAYERHWLAGGDIKLLAAGAAVFSTSATLDFFFYTALAGGALAAFTALYQRRLIGTLRNVSWSLALPGTPLEPSREHGSLPYGLAICAGAALATLANGFMGLRLPL
jgi:prepilin peptidase CpaA